MNLLYPRITWPHLRRMLGYAVLGALVAGAYGVGHDEITFTISREYFTKLKFAQFSYADVGLPLRWHVAEIGFLATWWVGFIAVWFLARLAVPAWPPAAARREILRGVILLLAGALLGGGAGYLWGLDARADDAAWLPMLIQHEVLAVRRFVRVALIHNGSYAGALVGWLGALLLMLKNRKRAAG